MNTRFYHAKILTLAENHRFEVTEGELWVEGDTIRYVGDGTDGRRLHGTGRLTRRAIF